MDFTLKAYCNLLDSLEDAGYVFAPIKDSFPSEGYESKKVVFLRHDVDLRPENSLAVASLEAERGIRSTYYFRAVPESWNEDIIRQIADLGHEIGYHYESLTTCSGDVDVAWMDFSENLQKLRELALVETVCMHGSPKSCYDSRDIWKKYDYRTLGIKGEPYLDTDWSKMFYLTDTGRRWDGYKVSVRDKIPVYQDEWCRQGLCFRHTQDIIDAASKLPPHIMITTHPQRWNDKLWPWTKELVLQNLKNAVKSVLLRH